MSRRHFLDDSIAQVQTKEKGNFRKSHKFHQLDYRFSVKQAPTPEKKPCHILESVCP